MSKKNSYEKKAQKKQLLEGTESHRGDLKQTALDTGRDMLIGAVGGGLAGAIIGRSSFLVGVVVTGAGHYMKSSGAAAFGIGMMASGGYQTVSGMSGTEKEGLEGVKERMQAFKEEFKKKLFLDKIIKPKEKTGDASESTNGVGDVQYFTYPNSKELEGADDTFHLNALDRIEKQVEASAQNFQAKQSMSGSGISGEEEMGMDFTDRNF